MSIDMQINCQKSFYIMSKSNGGGGTILYPVPVRTEVVLKQRYLLEKTILRVLWQMDAASQAPEIKSSGYIEVKSSRKAFLIDSLRWGESTMSRSTVQATYSRCAETILRSG